jgi:hypothetical protein
MEPLDNDIEVMLDKIKNPEKQTWYGSQGMLPFVYESPDGGKTVYARPFGSDPTQKILVRGEDK